MSAAQVERPIDRIESAFREAVLGTDLVVTAATGSGKSTRLPLWLADAGHRVLVIQPRRLAATSLAGFLAAEAGESPGERIGHAVRFDRTAGPGTRVVFVTPGIALQWYAADGLAGFSAVVLDEFHERRWDTDLLLALLRAGGAHRLVITSATLAADGLADYLGGRVLTAGGRGYPVSVGYRGESPRAMPHGGDLVPRVVAAVNEALGLDDGDVLVFLPGRGEIKGVAARLSVDADVVSLHAGSPPSDQRRALRPGGRRRVILATNVAETSLTVPGVTVVVDSGLQRRTFRRNGRTVLGLVPVSAASADQRLGRAGRTAPGHGLRLWGEAAPLEAQTPPEIVREDLTDLVLAAAVAGQRARDLDLPDAPPRGSLASAEQRLMTLGALEADGTASERGERLFRLPVDSWLAHLVVSMPDAATAGFMADLAAALTAGRWLSLSDDEAGRAVLDTRLPAGCDASLRVAALRSDEALPGVSVTARGRDEARRLAGQLRTAMDLPPAPAELDADAARRALTAAAAVLPEAVFLRRQRRRYALGNGEAEVVVDESSRLRGADELALVLEDHSRPGRGTRATVTVATCLAPLPLATLQAAGLTGHETARPHWDGERLTVTRRHAYAGRVVAEEPDCEPEGPEARTAAAELILAGRLLAPAGERLSDDLAAWRLYAALEGLEDNTPAAAEWLAGRLAALGVEDAGDIALLEADDLRFEGVPPWEREAFDRRYPRRVALTDLAMSVHYEPRRKAITLVREGGHRRRDPQRWELPAWPGWRVFYQSASRVVPIR